MTYTNLTGTTIRHAALRGVRLDSLAARRGTERLLAQIPDTVPGMGASAVLCVRQMSVRVRSRPRHMQSGGNMLDEEMERLARHAARPAHGPVPLNAEAVLFADRAELLSCVARDHVRHLLAQGWWWRVLLNTPDLTTAAAQLWVSEAAHVPTALARLALSNDVGDFVRALDLAEADAVTKAVVRAHGLALLAEVAATAPQLHSQSVSLPLSKPQNDDAHASPRPLEREISAALPEAWAPGLSVAKRRLLAVGLSLVRLPRLVRSAAFAQALPVLLAQANLHAIESKKESYDSVQAEHIGSSETSLSPDVSVVPEVLSATAALPILPAIQPLLRVHHSVAPAQAGAQASSGLLDSRLRRNDGTSKSELMIAPGVHLQVASAFDTGTRILETEYGGVFFLCNAALALGLYADFTRPLDRGLELSFWDFLALGAVDLGGPAVRRDPLWPLLAELAGRAPGHRPGAGFTPPNEWRMPVEWLIPFANDAADWTWEADAARLAVRHPAGFVVFDLPRSEVSAEEQLHVELAKYDVPGLKQSLRCQHKPVTPFARWRGWVMAYLGRRVARALGDARWHRACRLLLCLPGRIKLGAERLDVHFSLEQLPVAVRIAGLDRDPGWIPAAGRDLRFYFGCDHA